MNFLFVLFAASVLRSDVRGQIPETFPFSQSLTSFTCQGRPPGYYADLQTGCKTYHVCDGISHFTYVCPRRTLFQQSSRICDHSYLVTCGEEQTSQRDGEGEILFRAVENNKKLTRKETDEEAYYQTGGNFQTGIPTSTAIPTTYFDTVTPAIGIASGTASERIATFPASRRISTPAPLIGDSTAVSSRIATASPAKTVTPLPTASILTIPNGIVAASPAVKITSTKPFVRSATTSTQNPRPESTSVATEEDFVGQSVRKFLKFRVKDLRSLFFIPELESNSIAVSPEKELLLPLEKGDFMRFRNRKKESPSYSACPSYCNPRFFLPGTCHPCIMIK